MQKIATRIFIISSIIFGILGISLVLIPQGDSFDNQITLFTVIQKLFAVNAFIVVSSFALAVAGRFLNPKK